MLGGVLSTRRRGRINYPSVRVTSQREGNVKSPFRHGSNLGRARIVVI